jgi:hypothetical protein
MPNRRAASELACRWVGGRLRREAGQQSGGGLVAAVLEEELA